MAISTELLNVLLNSWPEGTKGNLEEFRVIQTLDGLGREVGYGALEQLAHWLYLAQCHGTTDEVVELKRETVQASRLAVTERFPWTASVSRACLSRR